MPNAHPLSQYPLHLRYVALSTPYPARLVRYSYLYLNQSPLFPSLWYRMRRGERVYGGREEMKHDSLLRVKTGECVTPLSPTSQLDTEKSHLSMNVLYLHGLQTIEF
jgi:hypothetical protein